MFLLFYVINVCCFFFFFNQQVPDLDALLTLVFSDLQQHPDKAEGAGQLLFEMCKGVRNMFHSCTSTVSHLSKEWVSLSVTIM